MKQNTHKMLKSVDNEKTIIIVLQQHKNNQHFEANLSVILAVLVFHVLFFTFIGT